MMDDIDSFVSKQLKRYEHVTIYRDQLDHAKQATQKQIGRINSWLIRVLGDIYFYVKFMFYPAAFILISILLYGVFALFKNKNILKFIACMLLFLIIGFASARYGFIIF